MKSRTILWALAALCFGIACTPSEPEVEETVSQKVNATLVSAEGHLAQSQQEPPHAQRGCPHSFWDCRTPSSQTKPMRGVQEYF